MTGTVDRATLDNLGLSAQTATNKNNRVSQEQFLDLMVAQLRNQDPFKPLESGEFLGQIAQFSTVTGIQDLQASFKELAGSMYSNQALQASTLVGRTVLTPSANVSLGAGGSVSGAIDLSVSTPDLSLGIYDASGQLVRRQPLGAHAAGVIPFSWDGLTDAGTPAAPGAYRIKAEARNSSQVLAQETLISARVDSVSLGAQGQNITLNLGGIGPVGFNDIRQVK
jgi:flagellar basal-body rod modification protein FlgD